MRTYIYNVSIASMLMCISDMTSQIFEGNGFDVKRNVKMTLLGGFTNGMCLTKWYRFIDVRFKGQIIPKILADQLIYSPLSISFFPFQNRDTFPGLLVKSSSNFTPCHLPMSS